MPDAFDRLAPKLLSVEGGYTNDPADSGGETNHGVTVAEARAAGYTGSMRHMTKEQALEIYRARFWIAPGFDKIAAISDAVAAELFDTGVNMGVSIPGPFLQRSLNVLNLRGTLYPDLKVDGQLGPATRGALQAYLAKRGTDGERVLLRMLNSLQGARYLELAERREKDERFVYGWFLHRVA